MQPSEDASSSVAAGVADGLSARIAEVRRALSAIRDPELDETVTAMGFIKAIEIAGGAVGVTFQLPTQWCAANFAFLMAVDIKAAVMALPWVTSADVVLRDHFAARRINEAVERDLSFVEAFPQKAEGELDGLRHTFMEKAFLARQHAVLDALPKTQAPSPALWTIADLEDLSRLSNDLAEPVARYLALRRNLPGEAAFVTARGAPVEPAHWQVHARELRGTAVTMAANAEHCRVLAAANQA
ncbi:MAG: iron-sulfur cluster assembly protein [Candidatus Kaistia colombiensis]|nr:MAG: iron-sulfur cluster assembly protein [Kaistia sp.]